MPDLEQQLPRFAEALDREAPAISVDEILSRGAVAVDVDRLEYPSWDQIPHVNGMSRIGAAPGHHEMDDRDPPVELDVSVAPRPPARGRVAWRVALGVAAAAALAVAIGAIVRVRAEPDPADLPPSTVATAPPTMTPPPPTSGGMWPQSTLEDVRAAQVRADNGDPGYTWQLDPQIVEDDSWTYERHQVELVDRFLREVLGWEAYMLNSSQGTPTGGRFPDERYLRCAAGRTNPLYPPGAEPQPGELCAPTIDDLHYESVSLDLAQLDRQGRDGIWVVERWEMTQPFAQADPAVVEAQGTDRMEEFLAARIDGRGAEGLVVRGQTVVEVPLLYSTTSGAPYERYEIERVDAHWPDGSGAFRIRLFADSDATVIEQVFIYWPDGLRMDEDATTENGQPVVVSHTSSDGKVSVSAPTTWTMWLPGKGPQARGVWFGAMWRPENFFGSGERIGLVDPVAYDSWCAANGGNPLLSAPADAAAITQQLLADPDFETTEPVAVRVGGLDALSMDVTLAPGGKACGIEMIDISRWIHEIGSDPGLRLRLYLVDLPEGMSVQTLAITVVAPEERFDEVIAETAPIIDSIEFHPG